MPKDEKKPELKMSENVCDFEGFGEETVVHSCTQWGKLEEVIVAKLPGDACFPPNGIDFRGECNNPHVRDTLPWPAGPKHPEVSLDLFTIRCTVKHFFPLRSPDGR